MLFKCKDEIFVIEFKLRLMGIKSLVAKDNNVETSGESVVVARTRVDRLSIRHQDQLL